MKRGEIYQNGNKHKAEEAKLAITKLTKNNSNQLITTIKVQTL